MYSVVGHKHIYWWNTYNIGYLKTEKEGYYKIRLWIKYVDINSYYLLLKPYQSQSHAWFEKRGGGEAHLKYILAEG